MLIEELSIFWEEKAFIRETYELTYQVQCFEQRVAAREFSAVTLELNFFKREVELFGLDQLLEERSHILEFRVDFVPVFDLLRAHYYLIRGLKSSQSGDS